jgi:hypothetical protein
MTEERERLLKLVAKVTFMTSAGALQWSRLEAESGPASHDFADVFYEAETSGLRLRLVRRRSPSPLSKVLANSANRSRPFNPSWESLDEIVLQVLSPSGGIGKELDVEDFPQLNSLFRLVHKDSSDVDVLIDRFVNF